MTRTLSGAFTAGLSAVSVPGLALLPGAVLLMGLLPGRVLACSCEPVAPLTVAEVTADAREGLLTYVGTVVGEDSTSSPEFRVYQVAVAHPLGGVVKEVEQVRSRASGAACGVRLSVGTTYLLRPSVRDPVPEVNLCGAPRQIVRDPSFIARVLAVTAVLRDTWARLKASIPGRWALGQAPIGRAAGPRSRPPPGAGLPPGDWRR